MAKIPVDFLPGNLIFEENKGQWHNSILYRVQIPGGYCHITPQGLVYVFEDYTKLHEITHRHDHSDSIAAHIVKMKWRHTRIKRSQILHSRPNAYYTNYHLGGKSFSKVNHVDTLYIKNLYPHIDMVLYSQLSNLKYDLIIHNGADLKILAFEYAGNQHIALNQNKLTWKHSLGEVLETEPISTLFDPVKKQLQQVDVQYLLQKNILRFSSNHLPKGSEVLRIDPTILFSSYVGAKADNFGFTATYDKQGNCYTGGVVYNYAGFEPFNTQMPVDSFPASPGGYQTRFQGGLTDVVIFVFSPDGRQRKYATYLGGNGAETPHSLIVNSKEQLLIYGATSSTDIFQSVSNSFDNTFNGLSNPSFYYQTETNFIRFNGYADAFIAALSADGDSLVSGTYFGGTLNDGIDTRLANSSSKNYFFLGDEFRGEIILDESDHVIIAGTTESNNIPIVNAGFNANLQGTQDGFLAKFNPSVSQLLFSTYIGGLGQEAISSVDIDRQGNIFVSGITNSASFLTSTTGLHTSALGGLDGFVAKFSANGLLLNHSFIGTPADDKAVFVRRDRSGAVYILGNTWGTYPITTSSGIIYSSPNSGQFIHKLSGNLTESIYSTTFGSGRGVPDMAVNAFVVNACGIPMVSGWMGDLKRVDENQIPVAVMPITSNALVGNAPDGKNKGFYFCSFTPNMRSLDYATFLGSGSSDHVDGGTSRFDEDGIIYQAVCAGCGGNSDTPAYPIGGVVWSNTNKNIVNCNIMGVKFDFQYKPLRAAIETLPPATTRTITGVAPLDVDFFNQSNKTTSGTSFSWRLITALDNELASKSVTAYRPEAFDEMDIYTVQLIGLDSSCNSTDKNILFRDTAQVVVVVLPTVTGNNVCEGTTGIITPIGAGSYEWLPPTSGLGINSQGTHATVTGIADSATYRIVAKSRNFLFNRFSDTMSVVIKTVKLRPRAYFTISPDTLGTLPFTVNLSNISTISGISSSVVWRFHDGLSSTNPTVTYTYTQLGKYPVTMTLKDRQVDCIAKDSVTRYITALPRLDNVLFCKGTSATLSASGSDRYIWYNEQGQIISTNASISVSVPGLYYVDIFDQKGNTYTLSADANEFPVKDITIQEEVNLATPSKSTISLTATPSLINGIWILPNGTQIQNQSVTLDIPNGESRTLTVSGVDTFGCTRRIVWKSQSTPIRIPNVFTPNGDGVNDRFFIPNTKPGTLKLTVYNRWGRKVYESSDYNYTDQWDGADEPDGIYYYSAEFVSDNTLYKGWIQLLR